MQKPLVQPLSTVSNPEFGELVQFFNETLGFCPNTIRKTYLEKKGWSAEKHNYQ